MAFWNDAPEVFRQYRWYIVFGDLNKDMNMDSIQYALKKASKPTMKIAEVQHKYLNHFYYYPGRVEWDPITVSFASVTQPSATQILNSVKNRSGYIFPGTDGSDTTANLKTISKKGAMAASSGGKIELRQIGEDGKLLESWYLWNPFFTDVKYDSLEYASEDILNLDVTIRFDYATLDDANADGFTTIAAPPAAGSK